MMMRRQQEDGGALVRRKRGTFDLCSLAALLAALGAHGLIFTSALAQQQRQRIAPSAPVLNLSVVAQDWHRYPGLAVADIIFNNENNYGVRHPVVACDFLDANGNVIATRGTTIFQTFPPASTIKIDGVHFSLREKNAIPGTCRVMSVTTLAAPN
jgi:hypothetical protein